MNCDACYLLHSRSSPDSDSKRDLLQKMAVKAAVNAGKSARTASAAVHASTTRKFSSSVSTVAVVAILMTAGVTKLLSGDVLGAHMFGTHNVEVAFVGMLALGAMYVMESATEKKSDTGKPKLS
jgi:hypothetical protein